MGLAGAFRRPAGDRALFELCRRQIRFAPRYPIQQPGQRGALPGGDAQLGRLPRRRPVLFDAFSDHRGGGALGGDDAADPRHRGVSGPVLPHPLLAQATGRLHRQARGGDRNRRHRCSDDHRSGQDGRPPDRFSAHAAMVRAVAQRPHHARGDAPDPRQLSRDFRPLPGDVRLLHPRHRYARPSGKSSTASPASAFGWATFATS